MNISNLQERLSKIDSLLKDKKVSELLAQKPKTNPPPENTAGINAPKIEGTAIPKPTFGSIEQKPAFDPTANKPLTGNLPMQTNVNPLAQKTKVAKEGTKDKKQKDPMKNKPKKDPKTLRKAAGEIWEDPSLADWPENDFRIFCGNLGNEVTDEMLALAFRKYPSFNRARVIRDKKSSKTKGFGFVSLLNADDYIKAMKEMNGKYIGNRPVKLTRSQWKQRALDSSTSEVQEVHFKKQKKT